MARKKDEKQKGAKKESKTREQLIQEKRSKLLGGLELVKATEDTIGRKQPEIKTEIKTINFSNCQSGKTINVPEGYKGLRIILQTNKAKKHENGEIVYDDNGAVVLELPIEVDEKDFAILFPSLYKGFTIKIIEELKYVETGISKLKRATIFIPVDMLNNDIKLKVRWREKMLETIYDLTFSDLDGEGERPAVEKSVPPVTRIKVDVKEDINKTVRKTRDCGTVEERIYKNALISNGIEKDDSRIMAKAKYRKERLTTPEKIALETISHRNAQD